MQLRRRRSLEEFNGAFDPELKTFIIVHGWKSGTDSDTVQNIKDNLLRMQDCNVIGKGGRTEAELGEATDPLRFQPSIGTKWRRTTFTWCPLGRRARSAPTWPR